MFKFITAESITTSSLHHPQLVATDHGISSLERLGEISFEAVIMGMSYATYLKYIQENFSCTLIPQKDQKSIYYEFEDSSNCDKLCVVLNARVSQYLDCFKN